MADDLLTPDKIREVFIEANRVLTTLHVTDVVYVCSSCGHNTYHYYIGRFEQLAICPACFKTQEQILAMAAK